MTCVSAIEAAWLPSLAEGSPLLSFSQPLVSPAPTYDASRHAVVCRVTPSYGVHAWELPPYPTELASAAPANRPDMVFRWFGRLLLEGGVVDGCLSELKAKEMLNDPPSLVTRERPAKKVGMGCVVGLLFFFFFFYFLCFWFMVCLLPAVDVFANGFCLVGCAPAGRRGGERGAEVWVIVFELVLCARLYQVPNTC